MKPYVEDVWLRVYTGVDDLIVVEIGQDGAVMRAGMTKHEARWSGQRLLELAGCSHHVMDSMGMQMAEAHAFANAATKCYCGKASR